MNFLIRQVFVTIISLSSLLFVSCDVTDNSDTGNITIKTDKYFYSADSLTIIVTEVNNNLSFPVYHICAGNIYLEELKNNVTVNSWKVHGFEECLAAVPTNQNQTTKFDVLPFVITSLITDATLDKSVMYRLKVELFKDKEFKEIIDSTLSYSNKFEITR